MTPQQIEEFNKKFSICFNIGVTPDDITKDNIINFITTLLEKQREEYVEMIEKLHDNGISEDTGLPHYLEYNKGYVIGYNEALEHSIKEIKSK